MKESAAPVSVHLIVQLALIDLTGVFSTAKFDMLTRGLFGSLQCVPDAQDIGVLLSISASKGLNYVQRLH